MELEFTREQAVSHLASALHNFTVERAAVLAEEFGLEFGALVAVRSAQQDAAALRALGVTTEELDSVELVHAH